MSTQKHILLPIGTGTEEIEAVTIIDTLRRADAIVTVASVDSNTTVKCSRDVVIAADTTIDKSTEQSYDAIVLPGGAAGAKALYNSATLHKLLQAQLQANKLVAAICAAPAVVLSGHKLLHNIDNIVCHPSFASKLTVTHDKKDTTTGHLLNGNTVETGDRVAVHNNIITSQGPGTALEFSLRIVETLYSAEHAQSVATPMITNFIGSSQQARQRLKQNTTLADVKALTMDAYGTIFDVYSVKDALEKYYPGKGESISQQWRIKQLDFSWIRSMSQNYAPFNVITTDALVTAVKQSGETITDDTKDKLIQQYQTLPCFKDAPDNIKNIHEKLGITTTLFSNGPIASQHKMTAASKIESLFQHYISADTIKVYKPDPRTYLHAHTLLKLQPHQCCLISSNPFDINGANNYGFHTVWINRKSMPFDELGTKPDHIVKDLHELYTLLEMFKQGK